MFLPCLTSFFISLLLLLLLPKSTIASQFDEDDDLATYITRPELRPPKFNVTTYKAESVTPGYWFTAPYANLYESVTSDRVFEQLDGSLAMSMILAPEENEEEDKRGVGWIVDNSFTLKKTVHMVDGVPKFNMHEFNVIEGGKTALMVAEQVEETDISELDGKHGTGRVTDNGFVEMDIDTESANFKWSGLTHIPLTKSETNVPYSLGAIMDAGTWDYIHMNSIDKNADGDYLVSGRHTCAIYKVSGEDGHIIWQLGGVEGDFKMEGFDFAYQHDARFRYENGSITVISFLNNAADLGTSIASYSSGMVIKVDTSTMKASLVHKWDRPDHELTRKRGNVQILNNLNTFIGWSANSYLSEYTPDGEMVLEAQFASHRFETYRTYKFNFTGKPEEPPVVKAFAFGTTPLAGATTTVYYVSWNGATEVTSWNFYAKNDHSTAADWILIGSTNKTGFETMYQADGFMKYVIAEGVSKTGERLGNSSVEVTTMPPNWSSFDSDSNDEFDDDELTEASSLSIQEAKDKLAKLTVKSSKLNARITALVRDVRVLLGVFLILFACCFLAAAGALVYLFRYRLHGSNGGYAAVEEGMKNAPQIGLEMRGHGGEREELLSSDERTSIDSLASLAAGSIAASSISDEHDVTDRHDPGQQHR
ncbi:MAG: hypothetical protein M1834_002911 [Cirrosporium novae-zelandiae]|nr:MAG: hypothetical protein M1834_002911 [Cirrosporium novae-zelandiae]